MALTTPNSSPIDGAMTALLPPPEIRMADWLREHFRDKDGHRFDETRVPWVTAPGGPCDAIDDPTIRRLWLQWAARMFKTQLGQTLQMKTADVDPCDMMFGSATQDLCEDVLARTYAMMDASPCFDGRLPAVRDRKKDEIRCELAKIYGGWARGNTSFADKDCRVLHGNEISKWRQDKTSTEGAPLPRFLKRAAAITDSKAVLESTPAQKKKCNVETGRLRSTNCRYFTPCPHCGRFDPIVKGDGEDPPGIFWEKGADGKSDPDVALKTAYYVCGHCKRDIRDEHRFAMMNAGVWVPEGCQVDHDRARRARELPPDDRSWLVGEPRRSGEDWGSQLSVYYALFHGWGQIGRDYLIAKKSTQTLRQYINEDLAETWVLVQRDTDAVALAKKIIHPTWPRGHVPPGYTLVTMGVDKQDASYPFVVDAWAPGKRSHTIDYGYAQSLDEIEQLLRKPWPLLDGSGALRCEQALIDAGFRPKGVGEFCRQCGRKGLRIKPCKGDWQTPFVYREAPQGKNTQMPGLVLVLVGSLDTQDWIETAVHELAPGDPESITVFCAAVHEHESFCEQLLNDGPIDGMDKHNNPTLSWDRLDESMPNDLRDGKRYSYAAMMLKTHGRGPASVVRTIESQAPPRTPEKQPVRRPGFATPWGEAFVATQRDR